MKNAVLTEKFIVEGTFGDKEVYISRCIPKVPNGNTGDFASRSAQHG